MKLHLIWSPKARQGLVDAALYIALDNPEAAEALLQRVDQALDRARQFPKSGRRIPEAPKDPARELVVPPLRVFYETSEKEVSVLAVLRSERNFSPDWLN